MKYLALVCIFLSLVGCGRVVLVEGPESKGEQGAAGTNGRDGVDANPVTVVKLCPGTTTYPSKFVEVAFCIQNKLYATYSANGGFSTELPPGTYGSNGVNASCNFIVGTNCDVHN